MTSSKQTSASFKRKTKIVATIGPASESGPVLAQLIKAGMNIARLNFSVDTNEARLKRFKNIHKEAAKLKTEVLVIGDLQGPKMRVGNLPDDIKLTVGQNIVLNTQTADYRNGEIPLPSPVFAAGTKVGDKVFFWDGKVAAQVTKVDRHLFHARVLRGRQLHGRVGVNAPGLTLRESILGEEDLHNLEFCKKLGVDYVAVSFVRNADDIREAKRLLKDTKIKVIAKIERPEALKNIAEIVKESDAVMVARGDLGVETPLAQLPIRQKEIIATAHKFNKPVIVATQMLESMRHEPLPTRAEVSDVANAVFDGSDAVMLSVETSKGDYPVEAVQIMNDILVETEKHLVSKSRPHKNLPLRGLFK